MGDWKQSGAIRALRRGRGRGGRLRARAFGPGRTGDDGAESQKSEETSGQEKAGKETELRGVEDTIRASEEQRRSIQAEIESIRTDKARLMDALITTTGRVQDAERGVAAADQRLTGLSDKAAALTSLVAGAPRRDRRSSGRPPAYGRKSAAGNPGAIG